jgi:hypothetical protein
MGLFRFLTASQDEQRCYYEQLTGKSGLDKGTAIAHGSFTKPSYDRQNSCGMAGLDKQLSPYLLHFLCRASCQVVF